MKWYKPSTLDSSPSKMPTQQDGSLFELGTSLSFYDGHGTSEVVVNEGVMPDDLTHTIRRQDGTRLQVHDAHLCLKLQADLSNIPKTPLDYCKKVGKGISKEEAEALARPRILTPIQQELMDWHHRLYISLSPRFFD